MDRNVELGSLAAAAESVSSVLRRRDGSEEKTEVDWLVGCDGAHSTIRKDLGLNFRGDTIPYDFALADLHVAGLDVPPDELAIFFHGDGMVLFIPIKGDRYRIIADPRALHRWVASRPNDRRGPGNRRPARRGTGEAFPPNLAGRFWHQ